MKATTKNQISRLVLLTGIVFLCNPIFGEISGIVKGRVIDKKNHPIEFATATLTNTDTQKTENGAMCDKNGNFTIEDVPTGEYILSISMVGYKKCESRKVKIDSNESFVGEKAFILKDSVQHLQGLVVIAKRKPVVKSPEKGLLTSSRTFENSNLQTYLSKSYNCLLNLNGIQRFDLTLGVKPILNYSKNLILNSF